MFEWFFKQTDLYGLKICMLMDFIDFIHDPSEIATDEIEVHIEHLMVWRNALADAMLSLRPEGVDIYDIESLNYVLH